MGYRDELEALRARLAAAEADRDAARDEARRLKSILHGEPRALTRRRARAVDPQWRSIPGGEPTPVTVRNASDRKIEVIWLSPEGKERSAGTLVPGGTVREQTYVGYCWRIVDADTGEILGHTRVESPDAPTIVFDADGVRSG
ncbi:MAG TPA: hypothetical protein RMH99_08635 [Sandaracinaceae bacterium LLY-WYZ-13_1]|nr:hypothetical protein [Sandaracinaceae bacterium LLY-WYZ-13_1]